MAIQEAYRLFRDDALVVNRRYQRKLVWSVAEKQALIESILRRYPVPLILLAGRPADRESERYEIIDGMQRLDAIFSFIEQRYPYNDRYFDIRESSRAGQEASRGSFKPIEIRSSETPESSQGLALLSPRECADILDYQIAVTIFPASSESEITEVFSRINSNGRQLSAQEKRQAGVINPFAELVRKVSSQLRQDDSSDVLLLSQMPEISIDSSRERQRYGIAAEDTFWCRHGVLTVKQLREGEDEQMIADIAASILLKEPLAASKELLDELYEPESAVYSRCLDALTTYSANRLSQEIVSTISVLAQVLDSTLPRTNGMRNLVRHRGKNSNPVRTPFYAIFMAFHNLIVEQKKTPVDYAKIVESLRGVDSRLTKGQHYVTTKDRVQNIGVVLGLIQSSFVHQEPPVLGHGPGQIIDFENSLRRSKVETSRYEFKQGLVRLDDSRGWEPRIGAKIAETACAIANTNPNTPGRIIIGVTDKNADTERIRRLDSITPIRVGDRDVVGIDREAKLRGVTVDEHLQRLIGEIRTSGLKEPLLGQVLASFDVIDYHGLSVAIVTVPAQREVSFINDKAFVRVHSNNESVEGPRLVGLVARFTAAG